ncbi:MAG TPA: peptide chain release factor N(5)-glutamine methyltransferase [Jatrophihabitantaceae bacterium]|jgi:release factor glutamine methyltransferase|nr:peptide chain release factor N(5)-glutamine methyltransferase [Jatrophihabitantaceae bacterium]
MITTRELLGSGAERLAAAGIGSAAVDARLLLEHCLGVRHNALILVDDVDTAAAMAYEDALGRREQREPLQHIVGTAPFRYLDVAVGPGVFIPRPETELLVDEILPHVGAGDVVVDLCSGSGALALALAHEVPDLDVVAVESDPEALVWLRRNATMVPVRVESADVTSGPVLASLTGRVAAVVSNPPYVPASTPVAPEVGADPPVAVFAGPDGLEVIPSVIDRAGELLRSGGVLAIEHDESHLDAVPDLLLATGRWRDVRCERDLAGRPRYCVAFRR